MITTSFRGDFNLIGHELIIPRAVFPRITTRSRCNLFTMRTRAQSYRRARSELYNSDTEQIVEIHMSAATVCVYTHIDGSCRFNRL